MSTLADYRRCSQIASFHIRTDLISLWDAVFPVVPREHPHLENIAPPGGKIPGELVRRKPALGGKRGTGRTLLFGERIEGCGAVWKDFILSLSLFWKGLGVTGGFLGHETTGGAFNVRQRI